VENVIEWYKENGRLNLPWRNTSNPWVILLAGCLLRKTTSRQVERIYSDFIQKYSTPHMIIADSISNIQDSIVSLGLGNIRARQMKIMAEQIITENNGKVPSSFKALKKLHGVGNYIASEVCLIAFGESRALMDTNMIRLLKRVFVTMGSPRKRPHTDKELWKFASEFVPQDILKAKMYNFGVLDLGNSICTSRNPQCDFCPCLAFCAYYQDN